MANGFPVATHASRHAQQKRESQETDQEEFSVAEATLKLFTKHSNLSVIATVAL